MVIPLDWNIFKKNTYYKYLRNLKKEKKKRKEKAEYFFKGNYYENASQRSHNLNIAPPAKNVMTQLDENLKSFTQVHCLFKLSTMT